jgi:ribosomal protein RSM22 (predicted rRNA methylase)
LEKYLMWEVASKAGKQTIEEIGYGRGYQSLERAWQEILFSLGYLWNQGKHIVFTCHQQRCAMKNPEGEDYNFFAPKLHRVGSACVSEWCDEVLCLKHSNASKKTEDGKTVPLAVSRVIACNDSLVVEAKNRLNMPNEIPLDFSVLAQYMFQPVQAPAKETK